MKSIKDGEKTFREAITEKSIPIPHEGVPRDLAQDAVQATADLAARVEALRTMQELIQSDKKKQKQASVQDTARSTPQEEPGENVRRVLRWLYVPWSWLVFIPFHLVTTLIFGITAVGVCLFSPRAAFHLGTLWGWLLCRMTPTRVIVKGRENIKKGQSYVIMSNHQSTLDILVFYGYFRRQFRWVMKKELRKVPALGWYCAAGGHIFIDRTNHEKAVASLKAAKPLLAGGISVMFFPEGKRSDNGQLREFKKGGFMLALELGLPILPVSISGSHHVLPRNAMKILPGKIQMTFHEPIDASRYSLEQREQLIQDVRNRIASVLTPWERGESTN